MAKQRYINTKFWSDPWIREKLNPLDRYLFLYLLTNEHSNICGIYEISVATIAFETGLDESDLTRNYFKRLEPKIYYKNNWIIIPNFIKHQNFKSPKIKTGIETALKGVPQEITDIAIRYGYGIDTPSYINLNIKLNNNINDSPLAPKGSKTSSKEKESPKEEKYPTKETISFFIEEVKKKFGTEPAVNYGKDGKLVKSALRKYGFEKVKKILEYYLDSKKCQEFGFNLSVAISTSTINSYLKDNEAYV